MDYTQARGQSVGLFAALFLQWEPDILLPPNKTLANIAPSIYNSFKWSTWLIVTEMAFEAMYAGSDNTWWSILDFSLAMFIAHMEGEEVEV